MVLWFYVSLVLLFSSSMVLWFSGMHTSATKQSLKFNQASLLVL